MVYKNSKDPLFKKLKILKFEDLIKLETLKFGYRVYNKIITQNICSKYVHNKTAYATRNHYRFLLPKYNKQELNKCILSECPRLLNTLKYDDVTVPSKTRFINIIKKSLFSKY